MITLATLQNATAQQVFSQVRTHLLTQMEKSSGYDEDGFQCYYRSGENLQLKCAAGCLIADDEYVPSMDKPYRNDGTAWDSLINQGFAPQEHRNMISELQHLHDHYPPHQWREQLYTLAAKYYLVCGV